MELSKYELESHPVPRNIGIVGLVLDQNRQNGSIFLDYP